VTSERMTNDANGLPLTIHLLTSLSTAGAIFLLKCGHIDTHTVTEITDHLTHGLDTASVLLVLFTLVVLIK